jgi:hypothetical protein
MWALFQTNYYFIKLRHREEFLWTNMERYYEKAKQDWGHGSSGRVLY